MSCKFVFKRTKFLDPNEDPYNCGYGSTKGIKCRGTSLDKRECPLWNGKTERTK